MKDVYGNALVVDKHYMFYTESNGIFTLTVGKFVNMTKKGLATIVREYTKSCTYISPLNKVPVSGKVSVKPFKLIPFNDNL